MRPTCDATLGRSHAEVTFPPGRVRGAGRLNILDASNKMRFGYCEAADDADWCKIARLDSFCERRLHAIMPTHQGIMHRGRDQSLLGDVDLARQVGRDWWLSIRFYPRAHPSGLYGLCWLHGKIQGLKTFIARASWTNPAAMHSTDKPCITRSIICRPCFSPR